MDKTAKKVTITMKPELLEVVDGYSKSMNISRSSAMSVFVSYGARVLMEIIEQEKERKERLFEHYRERYGYEDHSLLT